MPIRTCIFDLGNVLVFFSHEKMVQNIAEVSGATEDAVRAFLFESQFQAALETGKVTEKEFHAEFESRTGSAVSIDALRLAVGDIFELNAPMVPLLRELRAAGIRLVLLSNTCVTHVDFVRDRWSFLDLFDEITTSWEVGALKPDPRIYESALAQSKCEASDCFFTDDIEDYVTQAISMGIQAHIYHNAATTRTTLRSLGIEISPETP